MKLIFSLLLAVSSWWLVVRPAEAVGVGVRPQEIEIKSRVAEKTEARMWVTNTSNTPAIFSVTPDTLADWFKIAPNSFNLAGGAAQEVIITLNPQIDGAFATYLSLVASPITLDDVKAGTGLKVPVQLNILPSELWYKRVGTVTLIVVGVLLLLALAFSSGWYYHKRTSGWRGLMRREIDFIEEEERKIFKWFKK